MNLVTLMGNITQDIELKQTPNWQNVCSFSVATNKSWVNEKWEKQEKAEFHNCVAWSKTWELISKFFTKWDKILLTWEIQTRQWEAQDWTKKYKTEIIVNTFEFCWWNKKETKKEEELNIDDIF